jgi:small neutral amino acid transporter SnatA (MarC family)
MRLHGRYDAALMTLADRRERTRGFLARMIVALLTLLACTVTAIVICRRALGITLDDVRIAEEVFLAVGGLAWLPARHYFRR